LRTKDKIRGAEILEKKVEPKKDEKKK
jgi:hypothetical protein